MKKNYKTLMALILCAALMLNFMPTAYAVNENNTLGVTFTATLDTPELTVSDADQTVIMTVTTNKAIAVDGVSLKFTSSNDGIKATALADGSEIAFATGDYVSDSGTLTWSSPEYNDVNVTSVLVKAVFTVPAGTPAGEYTLSATNLELTNDYGTIWENSASASATLTITDGQGGGEGDGYTASISTTPLAVTKGATVPVTVNVNKDFASSEVKLTYDPAYLTLKGDATTYADEHTLTGAGIEVSNGTIKIVDSGESQSGTGAYVLNFEAIQDTGDGTTSVTLSYAGFSTAEEAKQEDLTPATGLNTLTITIDKPVYSVTLENIFESNQATVTEGENFVFLTNSNNYDYETVTIKMGENTVTATLGDNGEYTMEGNAFEVTESDGTWTVVGVTGALEISGTCTGKVYNVTVTDNEHKDKVEYSATAQYGEDYQFTASAEKQEADGVTPGWYYKATTTVGGTEYTSVTGTAVTIPGNQITGGFEITVTKEAIDATDVTFAITNSTGATATVTYKDSGETVVDTVKKNSIVKVTLSDTEYGYEYFVNGTAYTEGMEVTVGTTDFSLTVTRTAITVVGTVYEYLTLDNEQSMWLVVAGDAEIKGKLEAGGNVFTYDGKSMFWSSRYSAYCYLVVAELRDDVSTEVGVAEGTATEVAYNMDVNQSGKVDANDAQLVYDMYQTKAYYEELDTGNLVRRFLEADLNGALTNDQTLGIETADALAIITYRLSTATDW